MQNNFVFGVGGRTEEAGLALCDNYWDQVVHL
jgi:hypothetical protein